MRNGPSPLSVHIGMAAGGQPFHAAEAAKDPVTFHDDLKNMLLGIQKYQQHPFQPMRPKLKEVWRSGEVFLSKLATAEKAKAGPEILILVPSLINKAYILNLMERRSMMAWFGQQGVVPYLLDWGDSCKDEGQEDLSRLIHERFIPAIEHVSQKHGAKPHVLGYCMGGTILGAANALQALPVSSLIFLAAPWDFHGGSQSLLTRIKFWAPSGFGYLQERKDLPVDWIQSVFASLDPFTSVKKFSKFLAMRPDSEEAELFIAVEDWLNDGVPLPHGVAQTCLHEWFLNNTIGKHEWLLKGQPVALSNIKAPSLVIASKKDRLVEYDMSLPLHEKTPISRLHAPTCGHIGMIAGETALQDVWKPILGWVQEGWKTP